MAKSSNVLDWCIVRLGEDMNWWVREVSDPVRWDTDGLSIIDPRQLAHLIDLVEPLRDYGFDQDVMERAFIPFRIDKDLGNTLVRLARVKESIFDSDEKLFALPDILDEENGPYADLLDHLTRCRVKMLNDLFDFEQKLTIDEVEDEIREDQNAEFMEGKAIHAFEEITSVLDYVPTGWEGEDEEGAARSDDDEEDIETDDLPDLDEEDEKALEGDASLKWDEDEEASDEEKPKAEGEGDGEDDEDEDDEKDDDSDEEEDADEDERPKPRRRGR